MKRRAPTTTLLLCLTASLGACEIQKQLDPTNLEGSSSSSDVETDTTQPGIAVEDAAQVMAEARCGAYFACECFEGVDGAWIDGPTCIAELRTHFDAQIQIGQSLGLAFDATCAESYAGYYANRGCTDADATSHAALVDMATCSLFVGEDPAGSACAFEGFGGLPQTSTCAPGLVCPQGECVAPGAAGDPCVGSLRQECADGLVCDWSAASPTCVARIALGDACTEDTLCVDEAFCSDGICTPQAAEGEPCTDAFGCLYGFCNNAGPESVCESIATACTPYAFELADSCGDARSAVQSFIDQNSSCDDVSDCVAVDALCHDNTTCGQIALSADHDADALEAALALEDQQCTDCGADPCGGTMACDAGTCRLTFP